MSLSIASRMCMCRTSVHTVSVSERTAVLSSYAPIEDWNLYLHNRQKVMTMIRERKSSSRNGTQRVFRPIVNRKQVVRHRLVRKLVNERRNGVHRAVSDDQRRTLPPRILFLKQKKKRDAPRRIEKRGKHKNTHAPESQDSHAYTPPTPPGPQTPARATTPPPPPPRASALGLHAPNSCASATSFQVVGAPPPRSRSPLPGACSRAGGAHRGARGLRGRSIGCKEIRSA